VRVLVAGGHGVSSSWRLFIFSEAKWFHWRKIAAGVSRL